MHVKKQPALSNHGGFSRFRADCGLAPQLLLYPQESRTTLLHASGAYQFRRVRTQSHHGFMPSRRATRQPVAPDHSRNPNGLATGKWRGTFASASPAIGEDANGLRRHQLNPMRTYQSNTPRGTRKQI